MEVNYTCRERQMLLSAAEAALATTGQIDTSLRRRSATFYWRHVAIDAAPMRAKHEAVCGKRAGWHLRSFGSHGRWAQAASEKCGPLPAGVAKSVRRGELDSCVALKLDDLPEVRLRAHSSTQPPRRTTTLYRSAHSTVTSTPPPTSTSTRTSRSVAGIARAKPTPPDGTDSTLPGATPESRAGGASTA